uniref:p1177c n=1 Tax=Mycobacterium leprae TaxID=1769 RepID=Q49650_MYCLR|nr:p1177c [Mycobacterium leprae]
MHCKVVTQRLQELTWFGGLSLPVEKLPHPGHIVDLCGCMWMQNTVAALGFFIAPVRCYAVFGGTVHIAGTNLYFQRLALGPNDRGVQRLVHTIPRLSNVVFKPSRHRLPQRMHHADSGIAVADLVAQDTDADQVVNIVEVSPLDDHFLINRPVMLGPALHRRLDFRRTQGTYDLGTDLGQVGIAGRCTARYQPYDLLVFFGMQDRERQVFQLPLNTGHT